MQPGDPRADPAVVDLIELAGQWVAAADWSALLRTLRRLDDELADRFPDDRAFADRFRALHRLVDAASSRGDAAIGEGEAIRREYRQTTVG